jgi:hypothetical protein
MKKFKEFLAVLLFVSPLILQAQKDIEDLSFEDLKNNKLVSAFIWSDYKTGGDYPEVPEKFSEETAVILLKEEFYSYRSSTAKTGVGGNIKVRMIDREVVKIQKSQSIETYSSLRFYNYNPNKDLIGIRIIKKDGLIINVENNRLISDRNDKGEFVKIAIPNLEVGDIIDYYRFANFKDRYSTKFYSYRPDYILFVDEFPIVKQYLEFSIIKDTYLLFTLLNGVPEPKILDKDKGFKKKIIFETGMVDKYNTESRWVYPVLEFPGIRFQVGVGKGKKEEIRGYFFDPEKIITFKRTKSEIDNILYNNRILNPSIGNAKYYQKELIKEVDKYFDGKSNVGTKEKIEAAYGLVRGKSLSYTTHIQLFALFLKENNIKFDLINYIPRWKGDYSQVLSKSDVQDAIEIHLDDEDIYYSNISLNTLLGQTPTYFDGVDGIMVNVAAKIPKVRPEINKIVIPISKSSENVNRSFSHITLKEEVLKVKLKKTYTGKAKNRLQSKLPEILSEMEDAKRYHVKNYKKKYDDFDKEHKALIHVSLTDTVGDSKDVAYYKNGFENEVISDYDDGVDQVEKFELLSSGRYHDNPGLEFKTEFTIDGLVKKMGQDYLINVGKLIGGQVNIKDDERERSIPVYQDYNREYVYEFKIQIPDGYKVEGLEQLTYNVDNPTGSFISSAKVDGDMLVVNTLKAYKKIEVPAEDWHLVLEFLDAAFDFSEQKVLFKRI